MPIAPFKIYLLAFKSTKCKMLILHLLFDICILVFLSKHFNVAIANAIFSNMAVYLNIFEFGLWISIIHHSVKRNLWIAWLFFLASVLPPITSRDLDTRGALTWHVCYPFPFFSPPRVALSCRGVWWWWRSWFRDRPRWLSLELKMTSQTRYAVFDR